MNYLYRTLTSNMRVFYKDGHKYAEKNTGMYNGCRYHILSA